eukprot:6484976-Amphidinium_carterae.1
MLTWTPRAQAANTRSLLCCQSVGWMRSLMLTPKSLDWSLIFWNSAPLVPPDPNHMSEVNRAPFSPPDFTPQEDDLPDFDGEAEETKEDKKDNGIETGTKVEIAESPVAPATHPDNEHDVKAISSARGSEQPEVKEGRERATQAAPDQEEQQKEARSVSKGAPRAISDAEDEVVVTKEVTKIHSGEAEKAVNAPVVDEASQKVQAEQANRQYRDDLGRADELAGELHLGLVLDFLIKWGIDKSQLYDMAPKAHETSRH